MYKQLGIELNKCTSGDELITPNKVYSDGNCKYKYLEKLNDGDLCVIYSYNYYSDAGLTDRSDRCLFVVRKVTPIEYLLGFVVTRYGGEFKKIDIKDFYSLTFAPIKVA